MVLKKVLIVFLVVNVSLQIFSNWSLGFVLQNIRTVVQQLNWLLTKSKARVWACITVGNFLILYKVYNLMLFFYSGFLNDGVLSIVILKRITLSLETMKPFFLPKTGNWNIILGFTFNELTLNQFVTIKMSYSKMFGSTNSLD